MRVLTIALLVLCLPSVSSGLMCEETFDGEDGSLPDLFASTGDPDDAGALVIQGGAFAHTQLGSAHYIWRCEPMLTADSFALSVRGAEWEFAWRIDPSDPRLGTCMLLSHDDRHGEWAYSLSKVSWSCPDPGVCPECQFMWHSGTEEWTLVYPTGGPVQGPQLVWIWDPAPPYGHVVVYINQELVFDQACDPPQVGLVGLGCSGGEIGSASFEWVEFLWPDPVEQSTWGALKALYH
jgi:hypothetical protein